MHDFNVSGGSWRRLSNKRIPGDASACEDVDAEYRLMGELSK